MKVNGIEEDQTPITTTEQMDDLYSGLAAHMKKHPDDWR